MTEHKEYFDYLRGRSRLGLIYRNYWLYPRLDKYLYGRVLDIGCGVGDLLKFRPSAVGVDINLLAVEWCKNNGRDAYVMQPDILPFGDASFNCAVLDNVLEHLENPEPLLGEIHRVLSPGGRIVVGVPGRRGYASDSDHKVFYNKASLVKVMLSSHFNLECSFYMPFRFQWFDRHMAQYCLYGVFCRN